MDLGEKVESFCVKKCSHINIKPNPTNPPPTRCISFSQLLFGHNCTAGISKEKKLPANIMPPAKLVQKLVRALVCFLIKNTHIAPIMVHKVVKAAQIISGQKVSKSIVICDLKRLLYNLKYSILIAKRMLI